MWPGGLLKTFVFQSSVGKAYQISRSILCSVAQKLGKKRNHISSASLWNPILCHLYKRLFAISTCFCWIIKKYRVQNTMLAGMKKLSVSWTRKTKTCPSSLENDHTSFWTLEFFSNWKDSLQASCIFLCLQAWLNAFTKIFDINAGD